MFSKGSRAYAIFHFKCPHCHEGDFFVDNNPYNLAKAGDVLHECPVCHRRYSPEPGFYYGAMYVAYALAVATFVTAYVATIVLYPAASTGATIAIVLTSMLLLTPLLYALSKTMYAALFMGYKGVGITAKEQALADERRSEHTPAS
jgi:hypothetical protein